MHLPGKESKVVHPLPPIYNQESEILILGSIPSVKSREVGFYYGNPKNRFFKILSDIFHEEIMDDKDSKTQFLLQHHIALWDVIKSCTITNSSDSSIKDVVVNDISSIIKESKIKKIFTTGKKAYQLYNQYIFKETKIKAIYLPSSSPANQTIKYEDIISEYKKILISINSFGAKREED